MLRHWRWGRQQGFRRLIEEDQLNPLSRARLALSKRRWRRAHSIAPNAVPVYLVGLQRSGTNMIARGLEEAPEFEVRNENDRGAFERFQLRPNDVIRQIVAESGQRYVLFKPLCDSHRTPQLLDELRTPSPGRAIWAYRDVDGRVRSALAKFGSNNLDVLSRIAAGNGEGMWQAAGLSEQNRALLGRFDYATMSPESAAALFWYVRNSLYFELGLDQRADVLLVSYDAMVADPRSEMERICAFLGLEYRPELDAHVDARAVSADPPLAINDEVRRLCDELTSRLGLSRVNP
jgi:Sulfotransferase family